MQLITKLVVPRICNTFETKLTATLKACKVPAYLEVKKTNAPAEAQQVSR